MHGVCDLKMHQGFFELLWKWGSSYVYTYKKKKWLKPCPVDSFARHFKYPYNLLHDQFAEVISIDHEGT